MQVFLVVDDKSGEIRQGYLTRGEAERNCKKGGWVLDPIDIESPVELVKRYYQFRGLALPDDEFHALAFLASELGELSDALVSTIPPQGYYMPRVWC